MCVCWSMTGRDIVLQPPRERTMLLVACLWEMQPRGMSRTILIHEDIDMLLSSYFVNTVTGEHVGAASPSNVARHVNSSCLIT